MYEKQTEDIFNYHHYFIVDCTFCERQLQRATDPKEISDKIFVQYIYKCAHVHTTVEIKLLYE